jgi:hypothetical protein
VLTLTLTLTLILLHQPETTVTFGSIHRLCHSNYDLSTPTLIPGMPAKDTGVRHQPKLQMGVVVKAVIVRVS